MSKTLTRERLIARLKQMQGTKTQEQFAQELGISRPFLSDIYAGKRDPGEKVLGKLGLEREIVYREA